MSAQPSHYKILYQSSTKMVRVYINARVIVESVMANEADLIIGRLSSLLLKGLTITSGRVADETCPDHLLHLFLVLSGSNPQQHLQIASWCAFGQLGFLNLSSLV